MDNITPDKIMELIKNNPNLSISEEVVPPLDVDFCKHPVLGNIFKIGNNIYFIKYWSNEVLAKFYNGLGDLLWDEICKRGIGKEDG